MSTATNPKIDSDLESGTAALAEELLDPNGERTTLAEKLQVATARFDEARSDCTVGVERLEAIAQEMRSADKAARKVLSQERAELVGQIVHAPADVQAAAEDVVAALGEWAPLVHREARRRARSVQAKLTALEIKRNSARAAMDGQKAVTPEVAERIRQGGLHVAPELIDPKADQTTDHVNFRKFNEQIDETRAELEPLIDLACRAQRSLTSRFGEGYHDQLDGGAPGRRQWLAGVRHRTSRQVNPHVGFMDALKPLNA